MQVRTRWIHWGIPPRNLPWYFSTYLLEALDMEVTLPYLSYEVNTVLLLQPDQEITRKPNDRLRLLINIDENTLNKYETTVWVYPSLCWGSRLHC